MLSKFHMFLQLLNSSLVQAEQAQTFKSVSIVLGNESADLDSSVGSLLLAFLKYYQKNKECLNCPQHLYLPIINCNKIEVKSRFELVFLFQQTHLQLDNLIFKDQVDLQNLSQKQNFNVIMYDHNILSNTQLYLQPFVNEIVDHHEDKTENFQGFKDIRKIGSACSIVAHYFIQEENLIEKIIAYLLQATIIIDTFNFDETMKGSRWNQMDLEAFDYLKNRFYPDLDRNNFANQLFDLKFNEELNLDLGVELLFNKDYKSFEYLYGKVGYSVIMVPPISFFDKFNELDVLISNFMNQNQLVCHILMFAYPKGQSNQIQREVIKITQNKQLDIKIEELLSNYEKSDFQYKGQTIFKFKDPSSSISRKILEPMIAKIKI